LIFPNQAALPKLMSSTDTPAPPPSDTDLAACPRTRLFGALLCLYAILATALEFLQLKLPLLGWPYLLAARIFPEEASARLSGLLLCALLLAYGLYCLLRVHPLWRVSAVSLRQWQRFKSIRRGYYSLLVLLGLALFVSLDGLLVGSKPILLYYEGAFFSPAFSKKNISPADFCKDSTVPCTDYRQLQAHFAGSKNWLLMPPVPYDAGGDSQLPFARALQYDRQRGYCLQQEPYSGYAFSFYNNNSEQPCLRVILREGRIKGNAVVWSQQRKQLFNGDYRLLEEQAASDPALAGCLPQHGQLQLNTMVYHPAPPDSRHWLGTNSQGSDIVAMLFAGLSLNFQAALIYLPVIIIIISAIIPLAMKGLLLLLVLLVLFDWIGISSLMRTAALREKARDYIASARVIGASNTRIIFHHLLPNSLGLVVYMLPFSFSGMVLALASLDYLGFGLPPEYASWGRLLNDGLANLYKPWIVASAFCALVGLLLLITFIGEAVREACDPKQHSFYR